MAGAAAVEASLVDGGIPFLDEMLASLGGAFQLGKHQAKEDAETQIPQLPAG